MVQLHDTNFCIFYNSVMAFFDFKNNTASPVPVYSSYHSSADIHCRISVLGAKGVGKTAIIVRYLTRRYIGEYRSQIDVSYRHMISIDNKKAYIDMMDFSPKNEECLLPGLDVASSDCFLVVYSVADRVSFLKAVNIVSILRSLPSSVTTPLTLLGNKKDLEHSREVTLEELEKISTLLKCEYAELSVAESIDDIVPIIFNLLRKTLYDKQNPYASGHLGTVNLRTCSSSDPCLAKNQDRVFLYNINHPVGKGIQGFSNDRDNSAQEFLSDNSISTEAVLSYDNHRPREIATPANRCNVCCEVHSDRNVNFAKEFKSNSNYLDLPFKKIRTADRITLTRTRSLQGKERRTNNKRTKSKLVMKATNFTKDKWYDESRITHDQKKEPTLSKFLSCNRGLEDSIHSYCYKNPSNERYYKPETSILSYDIRKRDTAIQDHLVPGNGTTQCVSSCNKPPNRKHTLARIISSEPSTISDAQKLSPEIFKLSPILSPKSSAKPSPKPSPKPSKSQKDSKTSIIEFAYSRLSTTHDGPTVLKISKDYVNDKNPLGPWKIPVKRERERKFGVFGRGLLGNMFLKTSLPDLPKATASFYTKIDSIKKTIQKRSI